MMIIMIGTGHAGQIPGCQTPAGQSRHAANIHKYNNNNNDNDNNNNNNDDDDNDNDNC